MFIIHIVFYFAANLIALLALDYFVPGFDLMADPQSFLTVVVIFTALNTIVRPLFKYLLTTFIIFSFGLLILAINAGTLILLDYLSENITINGTTALIYSTLVMSLANTIIGTLNRLLFKKGH